MGGGVEERGGERKVGDGRWWAKEWKGVLGRSRRDKERRVGEGRGARARDERMRRKGTYMKMGWRREGGEATKKRGVRVPGVRGLKGVLLDSACGAGDTGERRVGKKRKGKGGEGGGGKIGKSKK